MLNSASNVGAQLRKPERITMNSIELKNTSLNETTIKQLINSAITARTFSYAPYSHFNTGAALLTKDDKIYQGCNIENAAFSPTNCAERTAFFKAISEGNKEFKAIAIVGGSSNKGIEDYCPPCGVCRQVMLEFCDPNNFYIILAKSESDYKIYTLAQLMPLNFTNDNINT